MDEISFFVPSSEIAGAEPAVPRLWDVSGVIVRRGRERNMAATYSDFARLIRPNVTLVLVEHLNFKTGQRQANRYCRCRNPGFVRDQKMRDITLCFGDTEAVH